jgi:hypothetical protein
MEFRPTRLESSGGDGGYFWKESTGSQEGIFRSSTSKINAKIEKLMNEDIETFWQGNTEGVVRENMEGIKNSHNEGRPEKERKVELVGSTCNA